MAQLNMYTPIHKGLRNLLFAASLSASSTDWNDEGDLVSLQEQVVRMFHVLRLHVLNEETYVHPLLSDRLVGVHKVLEAAHREQEGVLSDLEAFFYRARAADQSRRVQLGLEFYRVLNRFIALYLPHLDEEESRVMLMLSEAFTSDELMATYVTILKAQTEEDMLDDIDMMFPALTTDEVVELMGSGALWMSPELMQKAGPRAERAMATGRWRKVMDRMGAPAAAH